MEIVMAKLLRKNPAERYQTMSQLKADLELVAEGKDVQPVYVSRDKKTAPVDWHDSAKPAQPTGQPNIPLLALSCIVLLAVACFSIYSFYYHPSPHFFSHRTESGNTEFVFPEETGIKSEWSLGGKDYKPVGPGPVEVPAGGRMFLKAGQLFADQPEMFRHLRPDDLAGLNFNKVLRWNSKHFAEIAKLKMLEEINLSNLRLQGADLKYFSKLPHLMHLVVSDNYIKGADLTQLADLGQLQNLEANQLDDVGPLLDKLQNSQSISSLTLKGCDLTDVDLAKIGAIGQLRVLNVSQNNITIVGLRSLVGLKHLICLRMTKNHIGPEVIELLHNFSELGSLAIDTQSWSQVDKERLIRALPVDCTLE
jgi:hypothetical protein